MMRKLKLLVVLSVLMFAGCSTIEGGLDSVKLPRDDIARVQAAFNQAIAASPDLDNDGTINGLEWVALVQAAIAAWESRE